MLARRLVDSQIEPRPIDGDPRSVTCQYWGTKGAPLNIAQILDDHEAARVAIVAGSVEITYGELSSVTAGLRQTIYDHGVEADDRIVVLAGNEPAFAVGLLAALGAGARVTPIMATNPPAEILRQLSAIGPTLVLLGKDGEWFGEHAAKADFTTVEVPNSATISESSRGIAERNNDDVALMMLTSGTSGDPKVAMLTHGNLDAAQQAITTGVTDGLTADDVVFCTLPLSHIFGLNAVLLASLRAGSTIIMDRRFDPVASLDLIRDHAVTVLPGAPPMWRLWSVAEIPPGTFDSVRIALSGAASLPSEVFEEMNSRHGVVIEEGYGMTETASVLTTSRGHAVKQGSVGIPVPETEILIVDADGVPVDAGDSGEVVVRGPSIFAGYFDDEAMTADVLTPDGWLWTGDVGVFDDDGYLFLIDRLKDLIIVSGFNVYPAEVEGVLREHPDVSEAAVVGIDSVETGEAVVAYVCGNATPDDLARFAADRLSRYKCPTAYHIVDQLPVAPSGKLIRRELRL